MSSDALSLSKSKGVDVADTNVEIQLLSRWNITIIIIIITTTIFIVLSSTAPAICESSLWFKVGQRHVAANS